MRQLPPTSQTATCCHSFRSAVTLTRRARASAVMARDSTWAMSAARRTARRGGGGAGLTLPTAPAGALRVGWVKRATGSASDTSMANRNLRTAFLLLERHHGRSLLHVNASLALATP